MATLTIQNYTTNADAEMRKKYLEIIEKNISTDNLKFLSTLAIKPTINSSLKNPLKRGVLKSNV
jgi:ribosomal protein S3AE